VQWSELRARGSALIQELFVEGGATIDTPSGADDHTPVLVRTVIQPDGDVVCMVADAGRYATDPALRAEHREAVRAWCERFEGVVRTSAWWLERGVAAGVGLAAVGFAVAAWGFVVGAAVIVVEAAGGWINRVASWLTRLLRGSRSLAAKVGNWVQGVVASVAPVVAAGAALSRGALVALALPIFGAVCMLLGGWGARRWLRRAIGFRV
jgi:hypothetical protein